jgi:hypothetical protein
MSEISPEELLSILQKHKDFLGKFAELLDESYVLYDLDGEPMTPRMWGEYFSITIPESPSPQDLIKAQTRSTELLDTAMFYYAHSQLVADLFDESASTKHDQAFATLAAQFRGEGKRLPSVETMRAIANANNSDLVGSKATALARFNFWKAIVKKLEKQMKMLEEARWTLGIEAKIAGNR